MKSYMNAFSLYRQNPTQPMKLSYWETLLNSVQPQGLSQAHLAAWRQEFWGSQVVPDITHVECYEHRDSTSSATLFEELSQQPLAVRGSHAYIRSYGSPLIKLGNLLHATHPMQYMVLGWASEDGSETGAQEYGRELRRLSLPKAELGERTKARLRMAVSTHLEGRN